MLFNYEDSVPLSGHLILLFFYCVLNVITFFVYAIDKLAAKKHSWRINESTLHCLSILGGWLGAFFAQRVFRHKTKKTRFQIVFWFTVTINLLLLCAGCYALITTSLAVLNE